MTLDRPDLGHWPTVLTMIIVPSCVIALVLAGCVAKKRKLEFVHRTSWLMTVRPLCKHSSLLKRGVGKMDCQGVF